MIRTQYHLTEYTQGSSISNVLLVIIKDTYQGDTIYDINTDGTPNEDFVGAGIGLRGTETVTVYTEGNQYIFSYNGVPRSSNANGCKLMIGSVIETMSIIGTIISKGSSGGDWDTEVTSVAVDELNTKDEIALTILKELTKDLKSPVFSDATMRYFYCDMAYKWAESFLKVAAKDRSLYSQNNTETTEEIIGGE
jgi:hypothetical protein